MASSLLKPFKKQSISDLIIDRIMNQLINGELKPGDRLPTELEFSESLGVSRNVVREAMKVLVALGIAEIRKPEGTFIVEKYSQKLLNPCIYGLILDENSTRDLLELNISMLHEIIRLGRTRLTPARLKHMEDLFSLLDNTVKNPAETVDHMFELSTLFYKELTLLTDNPPMIQIYNVVLDILSQVRRSGFEYAVGSEDRAGWMHNYVLLIEYLRGNIESTDAVCDEIAEKWYTSLT